MVALIINPEGPAPNAACHNIGDWHLGNFPPKPERRLGSIVQVKADLVFEPKNFPASSKIDSYWRVSIFLTWRKQDDLHEKEFKDIYDWLFIL